MAFGVIWMVHCLSRVAAFVLSSSTGRWQTAGEFTMISLIDYAFSRRHYAYGCFYWELNTINKDLLMLNTGSMEFSIVDLPPREWREEVVAFVEAGEGRLGMFAIPEIGGDMCYYIRGNESDSSSQWQLEKAIPLPRNHHLIKAATGSRSFYACGNLIKHKIIVVVVVLFVPIAFWRESEEKKESFT
uniref:F-box associated domain-containing protein n=1 Tax=Aegilops tauschii TaxID=37682 RepID=M8BWG5_AEGTA